MDGVNLSGGMTDAHTQQHRKSVEGDAPSDHIPDHRHYVVFIHERSTIRFMAGPFDTKEQASALLPRVKEMIVQGNPHADSYEFATFCMGSDRCKRAINPVLAR